MINLDDRAASPTQFGHPKGLFLLFFAEMWERFSYYGMRALLVFYMIKGFLGYTDGEAYAVYGAYTALVYMTPFFGGVLADRLLGTRRAVVLGGLLMAAGHLLMTLENPAAFYLALGLLICGNGFFKPNMSSIIGALYPPGSTQRDGGFTIYYMGVNLGAAMSPLLCGYVGETYGWHYGFGLATLGMLIGVAVFVNWLPPDNVGAPPDRERLRRCPGGITQALVVLGAFTAAAALLVFRPDNPFSIAVNGFVALFLVAAAVVGCIALRGSGGAWINVEWSVYLGALLIVPVFALLVSGFALLRSDQRGVSLIPDRVVRQLAMDALAHRQLVELERELASPQLDQLRALEASWRELHEQQGALDERRLTDLSAVVDLVATDQLDDARDRLAHLYASYPRGGGKEILAMVLKEISRPAGLVLFLAGFIALVYLMFETVRLERIARQRMYVVLILTFFSMLFWSFFEQAGSSLNNFTDRNVDRVFERSLITADDVGRTISIQPTQEQLGYSFGDQLFTIDLLDRLREEHKADPAFQIAWTVTEDHVGMGIADRVMEVPASTFQSVNAIYILIFGLAFTFLWSALARFGWEPSTPVKFAMGLAQLGLGFGAFWVGAQVADERGMVAMSWLLLGYLLHTTGELCLSPVGLSMITRLSPARLVSTVMGVWFLATAFSQLLAAIIAQFTGVSGGDQLRTTTIPPPIETVAIYGDVFGKIAIVAVSCGLICLVLSPLLSRWMHAEVLERANQ